MVLIYKLSPAILYGDKSFHQLDILLNKTKLFLHWKGLYLDLKSYFSLSSTIRVFLGC
jgi:hypothetical protein